MKLILLCLLVTVSLHKALSYLTVSGKNLMYNGQQVYLSGVNIAWYHYDYDWGNGQYTNSKAQWSTWLSGINKAGGNSARVWLHVEGATSPNYDGSGNVIGTDANNTLISELGAFLDDAAKNNVFIVFVLWNGAVMRNQKTNDMLVSDTKLQTYLDKALTPMVKGLSGKKALAAWEIFNEAEGSLTLATDTDSCFNTQTQLTGTGAGWAGHHFTMKQNLRFHNLMASAIHTADSKALVTTGNWRYVVLSDKTPQSFNYYSDACLTKAGGKANGHMDFYQVHTYEWGTDSVIKNTADHYGLSKPLVVGEYSAKKSGDSAQDPATVAKHFYNSGYAGAWSWSYNSDTDDAKDPVASQNAEMTAIANEKTHGTVKVTIG